MKKKTSDGRYRLFSVLLYTVTGVLAGAVFVFSLATVIVFRQNEQNDLFEIRRENLVLLVLSMAAVLAAIGCALAFRKRKIPKIEKTFRRERSDLLSADDRPTFPWRMILVSGLFSLLMVLVIRGNATNDALQLDEIMQEFSAGNYDSLRTGGYLFVYPFQISYVLIGQVIAGIFGPSNYLIYQLLNVVCIVLNLYFLYLITWELFHDDAVCLVMELLSAGCWFYYVFATFVYSDLWSFPVQTAALWFVICYLKSYRWRDLAGAAVCIAAASLLKTNCYIALIAMIMILLIDAVHPDEEKAGEDSLKTAHTSERAAVRIFRAMLGSALIVLLTVGSQKAVNAAVAKAAGLENFPSGTPAITYIAMGMQETEGKYGWYNGRNVGLYREADFDQDKTKEAALRSIRESIAEFQNSGRYFLKFYAGKFLSQWGDPTCVSMREMEETERHVSEVSPLAESLIFGTGSHVLQWGMNVMHSVIYLGFCVYLWENLKKKISKAELLMVIFLFGGMLFHQLWEASGRYTMRYYLGMLPFAAWGIAAFISKIRASARKVRERSRAM